MLVFNTDIIVDEYYRFCFALRAKYDCNDQAVLKIQDTKFKTLNIILMDWYVGSNGKGTCH